MSIPKEGSRDIGDGIIISLAPDVCLTPVGSSSVPVPYSVFAYQSDDANTAATVRMTGKRAHNMGSVVTATKGDGPGSSGGVVSGTVGAACHPKGHSATVKIQGKPAVRHGDEWHMNNKNTVGKLTWVQGTEIFDPTPAIILAQDPELEAPSVSQYLDESTGPISPAVEAILRGMERAREEGLPVGSFEVAQALPQFRPDYDPSPRIPAIPNSMPSGRPPTAHSPRPANDNARPQPAQPNRIAGQTTLHPQRPQPSGPVLRDPGGAVGQAISQLWSHADSLMSGPVFEVSPDIYTQAAAADAALRQWAIDYSAANGGAPVPEFLWGAEQDSLNAVRLPGLNGITAARRDPAEGRAILRDYAEMHGIAPSELTEDEMRQILASENPMAVPRPETAPQSQVTPENVRSTRRNEEEEKPDPCEIGPYSVMQRKCAGRGGQAHHIVPDFTLRAGPRPALYAPDPTRLPNAPTLAQGMAICLTGQARATDRTGEHYAAHRVTDLAIAEAGAENTSLPGTATWRKIRRASLDGIEAAKPDCLPAAMAAIDAQFAGMPDSQALRAVMDYRKLPETTRDLLKTGQRL